MATLCTCTKQKVTASSVVSYHNHNHKLLHNAMQMRGNPASLRNVVRELLHHMGAVVAKLFAIKSQQRIASWAEEHAVKAKMQAGFRKDFCMTNNIFILRSLIDIQIQSRQKGKAGKLFDCIPGAALWQVLEELGVHGRNLDINKSPFTAYTAVKCHAMKLSHPMTLRYTLAVKVFACPETGCSIYVRLFGYMQISHSLNR